MGMLKWIADRNEAARKAKKESEKFWNELALADKMLRRFEEQASCEQSWHCFLYMTSRKFGTKFPVCILCTRGKNVDLFKEKDEVTELE